MGTPIAYATRDRATHGASPAFAGPWQHPQGSDPAWMGRLANVERICLALVGLIAAAILCAWLIPSLDGFLHPGWATMKANTALLLLLSAGSLALSQSLTPIAPSGALQRTSQLLALLVALVALAVLVEYIAGVSLGIDTLLAADAGAPRPGQMSPQTATALALLGIAMCFIRVRERLVGEAVDGVVFALCPLVLVVVSGYVFGAASLFGLSERTRTSPQTLLCLALLTLVVLMRRMEFGFFSILAGPGIGSRIARVTAPLTLALPFLLEASRLGMAHTGLASAAYATALAASAAGTMAFALVLVLAWRIDSLERQIHDLSLRDDMTGLYNRRGFFLLAERELRLASRSQVPFYVMFIDLDGLKRVNDTLGHDVGSEFLRETAELLRRSFRESDIVGRIGGDEFAVAGAHSVEGVTAASLRLESAASLRNKQPGHLYPLSFSVGHVVSDLSRLQTLEELLNRADSAMYARKRDKKMAR